MTLKNTKRERGRPRTGRIERFTIRATAETAEAFRKQAVEKQITIPDHFEELVDEHKKKEVECSPL